MIDANENMIGPHVDERIERLICRSLDAEASPAEVAELEAALSREPAARALFEDYRRNDRWASLALHADVAASGARRGGRFRAVWVTASAAVLAAAAVVILSFLPIFNRGEPVAVRPPSPTGTGPRLRAPSAAFVDYRNEDYQPRQRLQNVRRDLIGIRGDNPNVIFIIERSTRATQVVPVSGDF